MIRVFIVADHDSVRSALSVLLATYPDLSLVGQASSGVAAVEQCRRLQPDVIVFDSDVFSGDRTLTTRAMKAARPAVEIITLTHPEDFDCDELALESGGTTYLSKFAPADSLIQAIRASQAD